MVEPSQPQAHEAIPPTSSKPLDASIEDYSDPDFDDLDSKSIESR